MTGGVYKISACVSTQTLLNMRCDQRTNNAAASRCEAHIAKRSRQCLRAICKHALNIAQRLAAAMLMTSSAEYHVMSMPWLEHHLLRQPRYSERTSTVSVPIAKPVVDTQIQHNSQS